VCEPTGTFGSHTLRKVLQKLLGHGGQGERLVADPVAGTFFVATAARAQ